MDCCRRQFVCSQDVNSIEVLFMRRLFASLSLLILTVSPRTHASQSTTSSPRTAEDSNICDRSLYNPTLDDSAFNVWSNDTSYTVTKTIPWGGAGMRNAGRRNLRRKSMPAKLAKFASANKNKVGSLGFPLCYTEGNGFRCNVATRSRQCGLRSVVAPT